MFAAMLLAISIVALSQFALYYWRAVLAAVAGQTVSEGVLAAARVDNRNVTGEDFPTFATLHDLTPTLDPRAGGLGFVRLYYSDRGPRVRDGCQASARARCVVRSRACDLRALRRGADRCSPADELRTGGVASLLLID